MSSGVDALISVIKNRNLETIYTHALEKSTALYLITTY
jgi:hypothetical protein